MNWGQIKGAIREYTHRSDLTDALLATFLQVAEQRIYFGEQNTPKLRHSSMMKTVTQTNGVMPAGFLEAVKITKQNDPKATIDYTPLATLPGTRNAFSWNGQMLVLSEELAFPVDMTYYGKLDALVADGDSNWLTDNTPSIYMTAINVEVGDWMRDSEFASAQAAKYTSALSSLMSSDKAASMSGSRLVMRGQR